MFYNDFKTKYADVIKKGQERDATPHEKGLMTRRLAVLQTETAVSWRGPTACGCIVRMWVGLGRCKRIRQPPNSTRGRWLTIKSAWGGRTGLGVFACSGVGAVSGRQKHSPLSAHTNHRMSSPFHSILSG